MKSSTLKKWKRDALENLHDYKSEPERHAVLIRTLSKQVTRLVEEVEHLMHYVSEHSGRR